MDIIKLPSGIEFERKVYSKYTKDELHNTIKECYNIAHILRTLKLNSAYHHKIKQFIQTHSITIDHFKVVYRETNLIKNTHISNSRLKKRLISNGEIAQHCAICKMGPHWNNKPLTLQLDHINGNHYDNSLENLRLLCPNCHSQTETYTGRNLRKK